MIAVTPSGAGTIQLKFNGADAAVALHEDLAHPSRLLGVVTGLQDGDNVVEAAQRRRQAAGGGVSPALRARHCPGVQPAQRRNARTNAVASA